jgi:L-amino acid N-acyltransferase YncA
MSLDRYAAFENRIKFIKLLKHGDTWWRKVNHAPVYRALLPFNRYDVDAVRKDLPPLCYPQHAVLPGQSYNSYLNVVVYLPQYDVGELSKDAQRLLKLALRNHVTLRRATEERQFLEQAYPVYLSFQKRTRYNVAKWRLRREGFEQWVRGLFEFPEVIILAAYHAGELVAFETSCRVENDVLLMDMVHSDKGISLRVPDLIQHYYRTTARDIPGLRMISDGLLTRDRNINSFKIRRGGQILSLPARLHTNLFALWFLRRVPKRARDSLFGHKSAEFGLPSWTGGISEANLGYKNITAPLRGPLRTVFDFTTQAGARAAHRFSLRRFYRNLQDFGFSRTLIKALAVSCSPLFELRTYLLYRADLLRVKIPTNCDPAFVFRLVAPDELNLIRQIEQMEEWLDGSLIHRMRTGSVCLVALDANRVAGFNIANFRIMSLPNVRYRRRLRSGVVFSEQITVDKAYRGRGLGSALRYELFRLMRERGKRNLYGGTDAQNKANLALCRKVGLRVLAEVRFRKLLWRETTTVRRVSDADPSAQVLR